MAKRKVITRPKVKKLRNGSPKSPLRRRSSIAQRTVPTNLQEYDDRAKRLARRLEINQPFVSRDDNKSSLGLGFVAEMSDPQIDERISQCIKLSAENKINTKNAFSLEMIDFMSYMIKKRDVNTSNLQVASTLLDVSAKIYGFRVDGVHADVLKMIGGNGKHEKGDCNTEMNDNNAEMPDETDDSAKSQKKARKERKTSQKILTSLDSLRSNVETANPNSFIFNEVDLQTTDRLYQAILPQHANTYIYLNPRNDLLPDIVDSTREIPVNNTPLQCLKIEDFSNGHIYHSFALFDYLSWSVDKEIDLTPKKSQANNDALQFDLDASLPPDDDGNPRCGLNYFDMEDDENKENVDRCQGPINSAKYRPSSRKLRSSTKNKLAGSRIVRDCLQERDVNLNATRVSDEIGNYDCKNELDTTDLCPNTGDNEQQGENNAGDHDEAIVIPVPFIGDNLVEAPIIKKQIFIPYSQRAKKVDMRQLKESIWKELRSKIKEEIGENESRDKAEVENLEKIIGTKNFSEVYKELPKSLNKANAEALSFPVAFLSLLHVANEKNLILQSNDERSDVFVRQE